MKIGVVEMSSATKSKSKDKQASKEPQKLSSKPSGHVIAGGGVPASGYNPILGTFHTLETAPMSSGPPLHVNGHFCNIDETDDHIGNSLGTGIEYDSVSNNGSLSGESEDHKEKFSHPPSSQEAIPGADTDRREKIRQKNEKKHQRQKERRAQELHERCRGYLMSRKLEALAQQLVAMGFSSERATMALILNEGRVEESVAWLFEGGEDVDKHKEHNLDNGGNLKIDISEELARIADMENRYKCSKQEVERAIVSCEGDLDKAEESLQLQKQEPPSAPPKSDDPLTSNNGKPSVSVGQNSIRVQQKPPTSTYVQQKKDERDFNYMKVAIAAGPSVDPGSKNVQSLKRIQPKLEWAKPQQIAVPADKRWPSAMSNPAVSYSSASPLQASPPQSSPLLAKTEARHVAVGNELKRLQLGSVREPVMVMQRPQSLGANQALTSTVGSSVPGTLGGWYPNSLETMKPNGVMPHIPTTRNLSPSDVSTNQLYNQLRYQQQQFVSSSSSLDSHGGGIRGNGNWGRLGSPPTLAAASSLGLFSAVGSNGLSGSLSPVDWNSCGSLLQFDYNNIDWSLDRGSTTMRPIGTWQTMKAFKKTNVHMYNSNNSGLNVKSSMSPLLSNGNGVPVGGLQDGVASAETSAAGSREWSSPFEEKDLFSLPRQFVSSPSL